ncbi:MAG: type II secretion system protein [Gammaproteobacteria bacterium]|nr:type II secretion system protein [Gammaproteobacteria bacterium]
MVQKKKKTRGFTLVEMVTVIVLLAIIAVMLTPFIAKAMQAYSASKARADLVANGRLAIERIAREVRLAVPNSLSVLDSGSGIEFARSRAGGRYVDQFDNFSGEFSNTTLRFKKNTDLTGLYILGTTLSMASNDVLVIGNTSPSLLQAGITATPLSSITVTTGASDGTSQGQILNFTSQQFLIGSPGKHFAITDRTIEMGLTTTDLRWYSNAGLANYNGTPDWSTADPVLINNVTTLNFNYLPGSPQATGVLRMDMELTDSASGENIRLYHEVHMRNTP